MKISEARAEEIDDAWRAATQTQRLSMQRVSWVTVGDETSYFEESPSKLEQAAAERIAELEAALRNVVAITWDADTVREMRQRIEAVTDEVLPEPADKPTD